MSIWIATISALDGNNNPATLRFSDAAYIDSNGNYFEPRMIQPAIVQISPDDGGTFHCFSSASIGEIELLNNDYGLTYLADYAFDNGNCTLSLVNDDGTITDYLVCKIASMHDKSDNVYLTIRSMSDLLGNPQPNKKYRGDNILPNGLEGIAADIKGNMKPKVYGIVLNATPVLCNTSQLIYQFSDRNSCVVNAVYDKGSALTLGTNFTYANLATFLSTTVSVGYYNTCGGYVKLGAMPAGTITGDCTDGTGKAGDVMAAILAELNISMDATSQATLNTAGTIGIFISSETTTTSLLGQIVASVGGYWYFQGNVVYANLIALATTSTLTINDFEIEAIERTATGLGSNGVPITACSIQYNKIETVQQESDLAGSVTSAQKAFLMNQYRSSFIIDTNVLTRHPLAESIKIDSVLRNEVDAIAVGTRLLNLAKVRVDVVNLTAIVSEIPVLTLGQGITVFSVKLGYTTGRLLTIIGFNYDLKQKTVTLELIG